MIMKKSLFLVPGILVLILCSCQPRPDAEKIVPNALFTDHMVLQRDMPLPVWGQAEPGSRIKVKLAGQTQTAKANDQGRWQVIFPPMNEGGPYEMILQGKTSDTLHDILVGEVWLASGQSNMEMPVGGNGKVLNWQEELQQADHPDIRFFQVRKSMACQPRDTFVGSGWQGCSPASVQHFSAVGYFFARELQRRLGVPVGIIQSAWGGTVVEAWTCADTLRQFPSFRDTVTAILADRRSEEERVRSFVRRRAVWPDQIETILARAGTFRRGWQEASFPIASWPVMRLPTLWEEAGLREVDGVVWFARDLTLPASWEGREIIISLGRINDYDITWFNGHRIGRGTDVADLRVYHVPGPYVQRGRNRLTVAVLDIGNVGGLYGPSSAMYAACKGDTLSLAGPWKYRLDPGRIDVHRLPEKPDANAGVNRPTVLYNAMIRPLAPYALRGVIWYQGESNVPRAWEYRRLFPAMIRCWRSTWQRPGMPFLFVQLAAFHDPPEQPVDDPWAELREAQMLALHLPHTGMVVTIDIGDAHDIHPKNKQEVGRRLALLALARVYGREVAWSGPVPDTVIRSGDSLVIRFLHADGGLQTDGDPLRGFAIAGEDGRFVWAKARLDGQQVIVWSPQITKPLYVRYGWAANPCCNLFNGAGLPASPFRTDTFPVLTANHRQ